MAIEGSIADVSLADIGQLLAMGAKTGCLTLTDRSNFGYIYFEEGLVVYASVINRPDRLGELLVKNDAITRKDLANAMERHAHTKGMRLGEVLVSQGSLTEEELHRYITVQIEEAIYRLFTWTEGTFQFKPDETPEEGVFCISVTVNALLMEGARRVDEWSVIEKKIPSMDLIFRIEGDPAATEGVQLTEHQVRILPMIDGRHTVGDLVEESGLVEFETGKALYGLIQGGFARQSGRRVDGDEVAAAQRLEEALNLGLAFYRSGMVEDSAREFRKALEADPRNSEARKRLGMISLRAGRAQEALVHFDEMGGDASTSYSVLRNRALALERLGRFEEALGTLDDADESPVDDPELILARGIVQFKAGKGVAAVETLAAYRKRLGGKAPSPMFYAYAILAAGSQGDLEGALSLGREGLAEYPEDPAILVNTGAVVDWKGEAEAAEAYYSRALAAQPPLPQAYKAMGDYAMDRGDMKEAREHYEHAIELDPGLGEDVYIRLGTVAFQDADTKEAGVMWRRALEINPENAEVQAHLEQLGEAGGV